MKTSSHRKFEAILAACLGALLGGPTVALAQGPGSGDEVKTSRPSPRMLRRIWKQSRARRAKMTRLKELKRKIEVLRLAVPKLQSRAMNQADWYRSALQRYQRERATFLTRWNALWRRLGRRPVNLFSDVYAKHGINHIWSADTTDWKRARSRENNADGDDFYLYASATLPQSMVGKESYAIDWKVSGHDFEGKEESFFYHYNWSSSRDYLPLRWSNFTLRRRITGLGLTPGYYDVRGTLKVKGKYWFQREFHTVVKISQVSPLISAPPAYYYRRTDDRKIKLTKVYWRSRGAPKGEISPRKFMIKGKYEIDAKMTGRDKQMLVGATVYATWSSNKRAKGNPIRTAFRFRVTPMRTKGRFGGTYTSQVKDLDKGLNPGVYVLRVWILAREGYRTYWAYEDRPFTVKRQPQVIRR